MATWDHWIYKALGTHLCLLFFVPGGIVLFSFFIFLFTLYRSRGGHPFASCLIWIFVQAHFALFMPSRR